MTNKGNMYEFATTWNPLAGECPHGCIYCSTNKFYYPVLKDKYSGEIRLCERALNKQPNKIDATIFVCAQSDLFADKVPIKFIKRVLDECKNPHVTYFFQTKNPEAFLSFMELIPTNSILCCTIESDFVDASVYKGKVPSINERIKAMSNIDFIRKQITIEPIMKINDVVGFARSIRAINPEQVNIGANSYSKVKLNEPDKETVLQLISLLEEFTTVYQKSNLRRLLPQK